MATFLVELVLSAVLTQYTFSVGDGVTQFMIKTDTVNGGDGSALNMTLNWNDKQYSCTVNPSLMDTEYSCDGSSESAITPHPQIPYFIKLERSASDPSLQITQIKVTDNEGSWYEINQFCIAPIMQLDTAMSITPDSMPSCDNYASKDRYDAISLGVDSKFSLLYVDIAIFGERFSKINYFRPKNKEYKSKSGTLTINLYESGNSRRRRGRRLLASESAVEYNASDCFPFFISIDVSNDSIVSATNNDEWELDSVGLFPSCRYWNGSVAQWDPDGCFVFKISNSSVVCACRHLTTFSLTAEDFIPRANIPSLEDFRDITASNLVKYPTVWLCFVIFIVLFIVIGYLNPNKGNEGRSIVAYEDMIYHDIRKDKMLTDYSGKQVSAFSLHTPNQDKIGDGLLAMSSGEGNKQKMCTLHWNLFLIQLRNDHTLLSVFQRTAGTNFSTRQRLACFFMYLATIMVASAIFYGVSQEGRAFGDVTASFLMSLISTVPVLLCKQLFRKAKPTIVSSTTEEEFDDDKEEIEQEFEGNRTTSIRTQKIQQLKMTKTMVNTLDIVEKQKMNTTIRELNTVLKKAQRNKSRSQRIVLCEHIRVVIYNKLYPLPRWCKKFAWCILIIWSLSCALIAITYGLQFDLRYIERQNWLTHCWQNFEQLVIEKDLSEQQIGELQDSLNPHRSDNFAGSETSSSSWLLSLLTATALSVLLWQPLTVYCTTFIKLWMFTWNISMGLGPESMCTLCTTICNCAADDAEPELRLMQSISYVTGGSVVAHHNRPLDLIGFLGNDALFIDRLDAKQIEEKKEKLAAPTAGGDVVLSDSDSDETQDKEKENVEVVELVTTTTIAGDTESHFDIDSAPDDYFGRDENDSP